MPVKWTAEQDQILLLKILEVSDISVNSAAVAEAWPAGNVKPTARAISERLFKLRRNQRNGGSSGNFSLVGGKEGKPVTGSGSKLAMPRKRKSDDDDDIVLSTETPPVKRRARPPKQAKETKVKVESIENGHPSMPKVLPDSPVSMDETPLGCDGVEETPSKSEEANSVDLFAEGELGHGNSFIKSLEEDLAYYGS